MPKCPRDATELKSAREHDIDIDRCPTCKGAWYDNDELTLLEATVADDDSRRGMIDYAKRESEIDCPVCGTRMRAFNYRAYNLELDACTQSHGFWLDAGESERVRQLMLERVQGLQRSASAEVAWAKAKEGGSGGVLGSLKNMFRGDRR
jgi:Zn-finger nucleic acid-binding protein